MLDTSGIGGKAGSLVYSINSPGQGYIPADGSVVLQSTYPDLFASTGLIDAFLELEAAGSVPTADSRVLDSRTSQAGLVVAIGLKNFSTTPEPAIWTSTDDGATWTERTFPATASFTGIAENGGTFVIVGSEILTSTDGINWTLRSSAFPGDTDFDRKVMWSPSTSKFLIVANGLRTQYSNTGVTWTQGADPAVDFTPVPFGENGLEDIEFSGIVTGGNATGGDSKFWLTKDGGDSWLTFPDYNTHACLEMVAHQQDLPGSGIRFTTLYSPGVAYDRIYAKQQLLTGPNADVFGFENNPFSIAGSVVPGLIDSIKIRWALLPEADFRGQWLGVAADNSVELGPNLTSGELQVNPSANNVVGASVNADKGFFVFTDAGEVWRTPVKYPYNEATEFKVPTLSGTAPFTYWIKV